MIKYFTEELQYFYTNGRAVGGDAKVFKEIQEKGFELGYTWGLGGKQEISYKGQALYLNFRHKFFSYGEKPSYPSHSSPPEYIMDMMEYFDKNVRRCVVYNTELIVTKERIIPPKGYPIYGPEIEKLIALYREVSGTT